MAFISRNPKTILNPEAADGYISVEPKNLSAGQEFIGFYKNVYVDSVYNNKCYVFKGKDDGKDYLFYGTKSLHDELSYYTQGDLVSILYQGQRENKKGPFAGKMAHIWKVTGESTWIPSPEFVAQLQQEIYNRRLEVQRQIANTPGGNLGNMQQPMQRPVQQQMQPQPIMTQGFSTPNFAPASVAPGGYPNANPAPNPFLNQSLNPYGAKPTDPFG